MKITSYKIIGYGYEKPTFIFVTWKNGREIAISFSRPELEQTIKDLQDILLEYDRIEVEKSDS